MPASSLGFELRKPELRRTPKCCFRRTGDVKPSTCGNSPLLLHTVFSPNTQFPSSRRCAPILAALRERESNPASGPIPRARSRKPPIQVGRSTSQRTPCSVNLFECSLFQGKKTRRTRNRSCFLAVTCIVRCLDPGSVYGMRFRHPGPAFGLRCPDRCIGTEIGDGFAGPRTAGRSPWQEADVTYGRVYRAWP